MDFSIGLLLGGWTGAFIGIIVMCLVQINRR